MKRRFPVVAFLSSVVCLAAFGERAQAQTEQDRVWWRGLSQGARNSLILTKARSYLSSPARGLQCKVWVQKEVVFLASRSVVWLPANDSSCDWRWQWSTQAESVCSDRWDGVAMWPGQIIQAQVRTVTGGTSPHTMVVVSSGAASITVIDCNFKGDGTVREHTHTWAQFKGFVLHYTLYNVK